MQTENTFACVVCVCSILRNFLSSTPRNANASLPANLTARVVLPSDPSLKFVNHARQQALPYIVYSDAECIISPLEHDGGNTVRESKHIPCLLGFIVVRCDGKKMKKFFYRGADCVEKYFEALSRASD